MTRAVLYARFSSDRQNERSIDDQLRLCRDKARALGADVVGEYVDRALSGATAHRPGLRQMLAAVADGGADVVIAEALDRLSRSQRDTAGIFEDLRFAGVDIVTVAEGPIEEIHIGFKGTMNALFLRDLAQKVRRGQSGRIAKGRSAGGRSYGYRVVKKFDADGEPVRGLREIDPEQAEVVRRIFAGLAAGDSSRSIAKALNADGVPAPAGRQWNASTIHGNRGRRNGIAHNPLYMGVLLWNRVRMVKDPATGRRISRVNPESEWQAVEVPDLRIVDDATWNAVQARLEQDPRGGARAGRRLAGKRRPKYLLSGLVRCGCCGGSMVAKEPGRFGCSTHREAGTCDNGRSLNMAKAEARIFAGLKDKLLSPDRVAEYVRAVHDNVKRQRRDARRREGEARDRLRQVEKRIDGLLQAIQDGLYTPAMKDQMLALERERKTLKRQMAAAGDGDDGVVDMIPNLTDAFRRKVEYVEAALRAGVADAPAARDLLRGLIDHVTATPGEKRGEWQLQLHVLPDGIAALVGPTADQGGLVIAVVAEDRVGRYHQFPGMVVNV